MLNAPDLRKPKRVPFAWWLAYTLIALTIILGSVVIVMQRDATAPCRRDPGDPTFCAPPSR